MRKSHILPGLLAVALVAAAGCNRTDDTDVPTLPEETATTADANANVPPGAANVPGDDTVAGDQAGMASNPLTVATSEGIEGSFLADSAGTSLYFLEGDTDGSKCVDACTSTWPPFLVEGAMPNQSPGLDAALVGVVTRPDGSTQVSYGGHPLYRYSGDSGIGSTAGHGVEDQWGHWYLVTPAGGELGE
jgi:predicted lipoprotein with Yx(FWY)xxD motif